MIKKENWGTYKDKDIFLYTLDNGCGLTAEITNYGGIIKSLIYKGCDVVLGRDSFSEYLTNDGCFGALIGRNANRIVGAKFTLNGKTYNLAKNSVENNIHGGTIGFNKRVWNSEIIDGDEPALVLTIDSFDGEEGFPGNVDVTVTYTLTKNNSLKIHYEAVSDKDTIVNLTNHSYFNLNGHNSGVIDNHTVEVNADFFTPNAEDCAPYGEIKSVSGTAFDLRNPRLLSDSLNSDCEQIKMFGGFDHNFCLRDNGFRKCATLTGDKTGFVMEMYTDNIGVQIYTGNNIKEDRVCKDNTMYKIHQGICFETQAFPNAVNFSHFPSPILKAGNKYDTTTEYKFI